MASSCITYAFRKGEKYLLEELSKNELIQKIQKLEKENKALKEKIYEKIEETQQVDLPKNISNEEKVKIFMEVFKGRTDLYAKRWFRKFNCIAIPRRK